MSTFDRFDILAAFNLYSTEFAGTCRANAIQARCARLDYHPGRSDQALASLSENAQDIYLALVERLEGSEAADTARREIRPEAGDACIKLVTSDEDPTRISADVFYEFAEQWADAVGSLDGGTWEGTGDPGFVYDLLTWRPGLIADLRKQGYTLDLSEYSEPSVEELVIAKHAYLCEACEYDFRKAEKHCAG